MRPKQMIRSRAALLISIVSVGALGFVLGKASASRPEGKLQYEGFSVSGVNGLNDRQLEAVKAQVRMVSALPIKPEAAAFFRSQPIRISTKLKQPGGSDADGVILRPDGREAGGPVLLHELLHLYHNRRLLGGIENKEVEAAYSRAAREDLWPRDSYMMMNKAEFFAMTASAVLHGRLLRPPKNRRSVEDRLPYYYRWLTAEFGLQIAPVGKDGGGK
jgi:hypothetical protein